MLESFKTQELAKPKELGRETDKFKFFDVKDLPPLEGRKSDILPPPDVKDLPPLSVHLPAGGTWDGEKGNSTWHPDADAIPDSENRKGGNPEGKTWQELQDKYGIDGIEFKEGDPQFDPISKGEVRIEDFTTERDKNFRQADEKLAEQWTAENRDGKAWTPRDIANLRKEEGYTWHECRDMKTLQLVPKEIHNNVPHSGGISELKKQTA